MFNYPDKYIFVKKNVLSKHQCNQIITYIEESKNTVALSSNSYYYGFSCSVTSTPHNFLVESLTKNINEYVKKHNFLNVIGNSYSSWGIEDKYNLQKYFPGQSYSGEHMENGKDSTTSKRLLAWMFYLNNIYDGGQTYWPQQNFKKNAREGDLCIWPSSWTHSHYGIVSKKETKYIVTGWCSFL